MPEGLRAESDGCSGHVGRVKKNTTHALPLAWVGAELVAATSPRSSADHVGGDAGASRRGEGICRVGLALQNWGGAKVVAPISPSAGGRRVLLSGEVAPKRPY